MMDKKSVHTVSRIGSPVSSPKRLDLQIQHQSLLLVFKDLQPARNVQHDQEPDPALRSHHESSTARRRQAALHRLRAGGGTPQGERLRITTDANEFEQALISHHAATELRAACYQAAGEVTNLLLTWITRGPFTPAAPPEL